MDQPVIASTQYVAACPGCGAGAEWHGVQVLLAGAGSLRWDTECACPACGSSAAVCDDELPDGLREQLLAEHGRATLQVSPSARSAPVMQVLRASLGLDLTAAKAALHRIRLGEYTGTLPETELLARRLRASGVDAVARSPARAHEAWGMGHGA
ncbi:hypothetical protein ACH4SP_00475 [Streptomyces sp. NPDC021093]|uniref:hypothetical protein n=1 Tax=Streptomyces sp. NPDC021093 TaxID=3365112 RepID=UPI0037B8B51C